LNYCPIKKGCHPTASKSKINMGKRKERQQIDANEHELKKEE